MNPRTLLLAAAAALGLPATAAAQPATAGTPPRPNIIFILADDLGYADLGCFGSTKIRTPNLDRLAAEGMRFTQHYAGNAVCAPSRCTLLTGKHPGHAFVRHNRNVGPQDAFQGQLPLPAGEITLATLLRRSGYATAAFGKWGLGNTGTSGDPLDHGFDTFFGYDCQNLAHNYYPEYLVRDRRKVALDNPPIPFRSPVPKDADASDPANYARFSGRQYAPDLLAAEAQRFIRANQDRPFFLYFPTNVPHSSLQVPEDSLAEYLGQLPDTPHRGTGERSEYLPHRAPHAAYAAMITRLDREIGRLVALVKELGLEERTIFVFTSDNGPVPNRTGGSDSEFFRSAGPLRGRKASLYEGGIRVPLIVRWPGRIAAGAVSDRVTGFEDWLPTLLDMAGASGSRPAGLDGISFAATLRGEQQSPRPFLYRENPSNSGQQSVRVGDWKAVRLNLAPRNPQRAPPVSLELFDLARDPGETTDVAARHPDIVARLEQIMREQHVPSAEFPLPAIDRGTLR